jgi:hypothetical protein
VARWSRSRWTVSVVAVLLLAVVAALTLSKVHQRRYEADYTTTATLPLDRLGLCAEVELDGRLTGRAAPSRLDLAGWHSVAIRSPRVAVALEDCATGAVVTVDHLAVTQSWQDSSCRLEPEVGPGGEDQGLDEDGETWDWTGRPGSEECPAAQAFVRLTSADASRASLSDLDGVLRLTGRTWSAALCLTPTVSVTAEWGDRQQSVDFSLADACLER